MANMRIRAIALSVGLLGALGWAGCGSNPTRIFLTWELTQNGTSVTCASGETVEIVAAGVQITGIPCTAMSFTTNSVPSGTYAIQVSLVGADGTTESTTSIGPVAIASGATNDIGHVIFELSGTGSASFTWSLEMNNASVQCAPGEQVVFDFGTVNAITVPCADLATTIDGLAEGSYDLVVSLVMSSNPGQAESQTGDIPVTIAAGQTTVVPPIVFTL